MRNCTLTSRELLERAVRKDEEMTSSRPPSRSPSRDWRATSEYVQPISCVCVLNMSWAITVVGLSCCDYYKWRSFPYHCQIVLFVTVHTNINNYVMLFQTISRSYFPPLCIISSSAGVWASRLFSEQCQDILPSGPHCPRGGGQTEGRGGSCGGRGCPPTRRGDSSTTTPSRCRCVEFR